MQTMKCPHCDGKGQVIDPRAAGEAMRRKREAGQLSVRDVAKILGFSAPYISDLERGRRGWSNNLLARFTAAIRNHKSK